MPAQKVKQPRVTTARTQDCLLAVNGKLMVSMHASTAFAFRGTVIAGGHLTCLPGSDTHRQRSTLLEYVQTLPEAAYILMPEVGVVSSCGDCDSPVFCWARIGRAVLDLSRVRSEHVVTLA